MKSFLRLVCLLVFCPGWFATPSSAVAADGGVPATALRLFQAPQTLRADEVSLLWDVPTISGAGPAYEVWCDARLVGKTTKTHFTATGLLPGHDYVFSVRSVPVREAAFESNALSIHTPPAPAATVSVIDRGAIGDGRTMNTRAIQAAIDDCPPSGVVQIPAGIFLSGALYLKSDMTLEIAEGGVLKGSADPADYEPFNLNRFEGWEMKTHASLLNAGTLDHAGPTSLHNLSIRGRGTISGGGGKLSDAIRAAIPGVAGLRSRGRLILLMNARNVEISGLTLEETPCWTLHYIYSENVSIHGLTIRSAVLNGDGIDPDSSRNSYIFNCSFDTGDDCIAIKSGKNPEGNVINRPTENVRVSDCRFVRGHGISIGSEMSGGVRGVLVEDCVAGALLHGLQIKGTRERGGFVEDVVVRNCDLQQITVYTALPYNNDGQAAPTPPRFRNFEFDNIDLAKADPAKPVIVIDGFDTGAHRTQNVFFNGLTLPAQAKIKLDQVEGVSFTAVSTADGKKPSYVVTRSERVTY